VSILSKKHEHIFGFHAVQQKLKSDSSHHVLELWVQQKRQDVKIQTLLKQAKQQGIAVLCKAHLVKTKTTLKDILASLTEQPFLLILDEIQDPHNLGACLRTADAAGINAVIIPKNQACKLTCKHFTLAKKARYLVNRCNRTNSNHYI